jgi:hypothetical protein
MREIPSANGRRTALLGPIEDFAFLATAASLAALLVARQPSLAATIPALLPAALGCFALMGIELAVRQSGYGQCERWRFVLAWMLGVAAVTCRTLSISALPTCRLEW